MKPFLIALAAIVTPLHAGGLVPSQVPAAARWLIHADLDAMRASVTGTAVFAAIEKDHGEQLQAFKRMSSVHLLRDLNGVTLMGDGKSHEVAMFSGKFDRAHMTDIVKAADGYSEQGYDGITIHSWQDHGNTQHAAFTGDNLLIFSRQEIALKHELDVIKGTAQIMDASVFGSLAGNPLVVAGADLTEIPLPGDASKTLRLAKVVRAMALERDGRFVFQMMANSEDAAKADRLRRLLDGILALGETADARLASPEVRHEISIGGDNTEVHAELDMPVPLWLGILHDVAEMHASKHN